MEIMRLIAAGKTNKAIAGELLISEKDGRLLPNYPHCKLREENGRSQPLVLQLGQTSGGA